MARSGYLGFFGAAGLDAGRVGAAIDELIGALGRESTALGQQSHPLAERAGAGGRGGRPVHRPGRAQGVGERVHVADPGDRALRLLRGPGRPVGPIHRPNAVFAKVSRPEVARHFLEPAPPAMLAGLVAERPAHRRRGAARPRALPVAEDITVESDSGGHTDNRPLAPLFAADPPLRDEIVAEARVRRPIRLGAAGGIGTPAGGGGRVRPRRGVRR